MVDGDNLAAPGSYNIYDIAQREDTSPENEQTHVSTSWTPVDDGTVDDDEPAVAAPFHRSMSPLAENVTEPEVYTAADHQHYYNMHKFTLYETASRFLHCRV